MQRRREDQTQWAEEFPVEKEVNQRIFNGVIPLDIHLVRKSAPSQRSYAFNTIALVIAR